MKLSKKLKQTIVRVLTTITLVSIMLAGMQLAGFSMPKRSNLNQNDSKQHEINKLSKSTSLAAGISVAEDGAIICDSIVQGVRDADLEDGTYTFRVEGKTSTGEVETKDYKIELINYYDDVTYTENVSLGDTMTDYKMLVVKYHKNLTINQGVTVTATTTNNLTYKKGMYLCVKGTLTNNGTISMTARGTYNQTGENVYLWKNVNNSYEYVPANGAAGLASHVASGYCGVGHVGKAGTNRATGGGGQGGYITNGNNNSSASYIGSSTGGNSYAGGNGGGGIVRCNAGPIGAGESQASANRGGNASAYDGGSNTYYFAGGGAGIAGGNSSYCRLGTGNTETTGQAGVGGLLVLYADSIENKGTIASKGSHGADAWCGLPGSYRGSVGGGGSGGGSINIFTNSISAVGTITAEGGAGGNVQRCTNGNMGYYNGGAGGNGSVTITQLMPNINYSTKQITLKTGNTYNIDQNEIKLLEQNEVQTGAVSIQNLKFECLDENIAQVSNTGVITAINPGKTKIKITETTNNISTYVYLEVVNNVKIDVQEGQNFTVALKQNGTVWSYGLNDKGQLGIGNNDNKTSPTKVQNLNNVTQIAVGDSHALALLQDGTVYAFGAGAKGQLGYGEESDSNIPVKVDGISNIVKIDAYKNTSTAIDKDGKLYIWGEGYASLPMRVVFPEKIADVSGIIILTESGKVYLTTDLTTPVSGLSKIAKIACGETHGIVIDVNGVAYAWGTNTYGECGTSTTGNIKVFELAYNMYDVSAGNHISILQDNNKNVYVLGNNSSGQIGLGGTSKATSLTQITLSENIDIEVISAGEGTHSGLVDVNGYVWHTGLNTYGNIGIGNTTSQTSFIKTGDSIVTTNQKDLVYLDIGEEITLYDILENTYNLKIDLIDDNQNNFNIALSNNNSLELNNRKITATDYGRTVVTITHTPTGKSKEIVISSVMKMESIVQGFRDTSLPNGEYEILIQDQTYQVELINYYDDMHYSLDEGQTSKTVSLGDDSKDYKTLIVKYHGNLVVDEGVTLTATTVDNLTYKKGMYICVLGNTTNNGTITMTGRGTYNVEGENVYLWKNIDSSYEYVPAEGGAGHEAVQSYLIGGQKYQGLQGKSGEKRSTGGGGQGSAIINGNDGSRYSWHGITTAGNSYSGGNGSGGFVRCNDSAVQASATQASETNGGNAHAWDTNPNSSYFAGGGAGHQGGASSYNRMSGTSDTKGENGTGGLLILYTNLLTNTGEITAEGCKGAGGSFYGTKRYNGVVGGGGSGGGSVNIFAKSIDQVSVISADGGLGGDVSTSQNVSMGRTNGGQGGNGSVTINLLGSVLNYPQKSIRLNVLENYNIDLNKLSYVKQNDIQTEDLTMGTLIFESLNTDIATVDSAGKITGVAVGKTRIKITDVDNEYSTYIIVNVTKEGLVNPEIKEGETFTVALKANGTVWTYGSNDKGQLGIGNGEDTAAGSNTTGTGSTETSSSGTGSSNNTQNTNQAITESNKPVQVIKEDGTELENIVHIEADSSSAIAVDESGEVYTWGEVYVWSNPTSAEDNNGGNSSESGTTGTNQTPTAMPQSQYYATKIEGLNNIARVGIYNQNFYAIDKTGNLYSWGKDYQNITAVPISAPIADISRDILLGEDGLVYYTANTVQTIPYLSNICEIEAGEDHYLFVNLDGYVYSIGKNNVGQLGDGTLKDRNVPTLVKTLDGYLTNVANISAGTRTSMAVTYNGEAYAWGDNSNSKMGLTNESLVDAVKVKAIQVTTLQDKEDKEIQLQKIEIVETGKNHSSISDIEGFVYSSGNNTNGELGTEDNENRTLFTKIGTIGIITRPEFITVKKGSSKNIAIIPNNSFNLKTDISYNADITTNPTNIKEATIEEIVGIDNSDVTNAKDFIENYKITGNKIGRNAIVAKTIDSTKTIWVNVVDDEQSKASAKVTNGNRFTISLKSDGTVWSWGTNNYGQLGLGTSEEQNEPQQVEVQEEIIDISTGENHTLLLGKSGKVYSFGLNSNGQLGTGNSTTYKAPVDINLSNISKVVAQNNTSFAITDEGKLYAWGNNYSKTPVILEIEKNIIDVSQNYYLADDGIVRSLSMSIPIILSLNETDPSEMPVLENDKIVQISEGTDHILMLAENGRVYSYGTNTYGQLGDGTLTPRQSRISTAVKIAQGNMLENVKEISAGDKYSIAVTADGKVYVFGINGNMQLGFNSDIDEGGIQESGYAILKEDITNVERVTSGYVHTSVYKEDGNVYTFGEGTDGELGNGANSSYYEPQLVGKNIIKTDKNEIIVEVEETTNIQAWINYFNLFKDKQSTFTFEVLDSSLALVDVNTGSLMGLAPGRTTIIVNETGTNEIAVIKLLVLEKGTRPNNMTISVEPQVETMGTHTTMLKVDGSVWCYGLGSYGELGNGYTNNSDEPVKALFPAGTVITKIAVGEFHNLALDSNGHVWAWGRNNYYQLGTTNTSSILRPTEIASINNAKDIACGSYTSFIVTNEGDVYSCGLNANGEGGIGSYTNRIPLMKAKFITDVIDIKAGKNHTIALKSNGEIYVTGSNLYGELALGTDTRKTNKFTKVEGLTNVVAITAGDSNNMVIKSDGKVYAWGENIYKELGISGTGTSTSYINTVTQIPGLKDIRYIDGGKGYSLAVNSNGEVFEAGLNSTGELGNNTRTNVTAFTKLTTINNVLQLSAGNAYTAYAKTDGTVWANGDYTHGDTDIKSKTRSNIPVLVGNDETGLGITEITIGVNNTKNIIANCAYAFNLIKLDDNFTDTLSYTSLNEDIATVDENAIVTGKRIGTTRVNAVSSINGRTYSVLVKVVENSSQVAPKVESGENFAYVLKADGSLWTFGYNADGRLAIGNYLTKDTPTKTNILATYTDIKAGKDFVIALRSDGKAWSVGNNESGQLGNGTTTNKAKLAEIQGMSDIIKIAAGDNFGIALDELGLVYKWGDGALKPTQIAVGNQRIVDISAGKNQCVFVTVNGNVIGCTSDSTTGISGAGLSSGSTGTSGILNGKIEGMNTAIKAQVTNNSIIILTNEGTVFEYKNGTLTQIPIANVIDISADANNVMYQTSDEKTYVSGLNANGELGTGNNSSISTPILTTAHNDNTFGIGVGYNNTYIINNAGNLYSAGLNTYGNLGNGTRTDSLEHLLVGNRKFNIKPESATMKVGDVETVVVTGDPFNVFGNKEIGSEEYNWNVDDNTIVNVEPGKFTASSEGTAHITITDKFTNEEVELTRIVVGQEKDRIKQISVNDKNASLTVDSTADNMKYEVEIITNENTGILNITTNNLTDRISIDGGSTWGYNGILNQEISVTDKITQIPIIVGIKNNEGDYPVEENYILTIRKITDDIEIKKITVTSDNEDGTQSIITATPVSLTKYEAVIENGTVLTLADVLANCEYTKVSIDGLEYTLQEQTKYITIGNKLSKEVKIALESEAGTIAEYTLVIYKKNEAMELSSLKVNDKQATKVSEGAYAITVAKDCNIANIVATATNNLAAISIANDSYNTQISTKTIDINSDTTEVSIKVKLGEEIKEYTLSIYREKEDIQEIEIKMDMVMVNGNVIEPESDGLTYIAYLPSAETEATIRAIAKDSSIHVKIDNNEKELADSTAIVQTPNIENTYPILLMNDDGIAEQYIVKIRKAEADTSLKEIYATKNNKETQAKLQPDGTYLIKVPSNYEDVNVTAITGYSLAKVQVNETGTFVVHEDTQNVTLTGDVTEVKITVQSKDGSMETEYILKIQKQSNDTELLKVEVEEIIEDGTGTSATEATIGADGNYHYYLTNPATAVNIKAITNDENAYVKIGSSQYSIHEITKQTDISSKQTTVIIKVKAEDGTLKDYTLIIEGLPDDTTIQKVVVNGIEATYIEGKNRYEIRSDATSFNVEVTLTDLLASMVLGTNERAIGTDAIIVSKATTGTGSGSGTTSNQSTETQVIVKVTSQNGLETEEYVIAILEKSSNTNIDMLTVNGKIITPKADGTYYAPIKHAETEIKVKAQAEDLYATTQIDANLNNSYIAQVTEAVVEGKDIYNYEIKVTAEDGTVNTYYLTVERLEENTNVTSVQVGENENEFNEATLQPDGTYYYKVPRISKAYVNIELESEKSSVTINGILGPLVEVNLPKEKNEIPVIVKAEDGTIRPITLIIEKMSNDTTVKSVEGTGILRTALNSDYADVYVDEDLTSVDLTITLTSLLGKLKLQDEEDFETNTVSRTIDLTNYEENGVIIVTLNIVAEDGTEAEYIVNIYKEADLTMKNVIVNGDALVYDEINGRYSKLVAYGNKPEIVINSNNSLQTIQLLNEAGTTVIATGTGTLSTTQTLSTTAENPLELITKYVIKIQSHNGEDYGYKTYDLWIRQRSIETGIIFIKVDGLGTTVSDTTYSSTVSGKEAYPVEIKLKDSKAHVRIEDTNSNVLINNQTGVLTGNLAIPDGETKTFKVVVTSENGEVKNYTLTIERISSNYEIESIKVTDYDTDETTIITKDVVIYDSNTKTYKIIVNKNLTASDIEVKAVSSFTNILLDDIYTANGTVTMTKPLSGIGINQVTIKLTAADGSIDNRYLQIVQLSDEIGIDTLEVDGVKVEADENGNYEHTVTDESDIAVVYVGLPIDTSKVSINNQSDQLLEAIADIHKGTNRQLIIPIKVTAEDGTNYTYTLTLNIISHDTNVQYVKVDDTTCVFNGEKYTVYIDKYETEADVEIKAKVEYSTIKHIMESGSEVSNVHVLTYKVDTSDLNTEVFTSTFTVIAEDGTAQEYEIELTRKNDDNTVQEVFANRVELEALTGNETYQDGTYYVQIVENTAKIMVIANNTLSLVSIGDGISYTEWAAATGAGTGTGTGTGTGIGEETGTGIGEETGTGTGSGLGTGGSLNVNYNSSYGDLEKTITLSSTDKVTVVPFKVTSQQGTVYENVVFIERVSANNNLEFVKVNYVEAEYVEDQENTLISYIYDTVTSVNVEIKSENEQATIVRTTEEGITYLDETGASFTAKGTLTLNVLTPNTIETIYFKIIAENGDESEVYTLNVEKMSTDATLKEIYVDGVLIEPDETGKYKTSLLDTNTAPLIKAITNNEKAYVRVALGNENLHITEQNVTLSNSKQITIPITVRSQAGPTKVTYLYITKISTSLKLSEVTLNGKDADVYDSSSSTYRFLVNSDETDFELFVLAESDYSTLEYEETTYEASIRTNVHVDQEEQGKILKVKQYSEAGESAEHTIEIVRISDNTNLAYLKVNNITRQPSEPNGDTYLVPITKDATSVLIEVQTEYSFANVRLGDNTVVRQHDKGVLLCDDLEEQRIIVPIVVTAADGITIRTYNIILERKGSSLAGKVITQNSEDKHIADIYIYKTWDTRDIDDEEDPRELIYSGQTDEEGNYEVEIQPDEEYDIIIKKDGYLTHTITKVAVEEFKQTEVQDAILYAGDVDNNGEIELDDLVEFNEQIGKEVTDENKKFDLNEDGFINNVDRKILKGNYHKQSEEEDWVNSED